VSIEGKANRVLAVGDRFLAVLLVTIVTLTSMQVCGRYLFGASLLWVQELVRLLFVWLVMIGTASACLRASHIAFDGFVERMGEIWAPRVRMTMALASIGFMVVVTLTGAELVFRNVGQRTAVLDLPMSLAYAAIPVGACLGAIGLAVAAWRTRGH